MKHTFILIGTVLIMLSGCGGGGGSSVNGDSAYVPTDPSGPKEIAMQPHKPYTVYPGDKIVKTTDNAEVHIAHTDGQPTSTVTLIAGDAKLIRR
jgi:hypothetical protein